MVWRAVAVAVMCLVSSSPAGAQWSPPTPLAPIGAPRALVPDSDGGLSLFVSGPHPARYTWPAMGGRPVTSPLPRFAGGDLWQPWAANGRGDVVMTSRSFERAVRALAVDAGGTRAAMRTRLAGTAGIVRAAVGPDGTAAVAWNEEREQVDEAHRYLTVRIRPPGGLFGPPIVIVTPGPVRALDVAVRAGGLVEFVLAYYDGERHQLLHGELRAGMPVGPLARVASTQAAAPMALTLVPGGPGEGRVLFTAGELVERFDAVRRIGPATWGARQRLGGDAFVEETVPVALLPDGTTVVAHESGGQINVLRAPPGASFGAPQPVARVTRGWFGFMPVVAAGADGSLLVAWDEMSDENERYIFVCALGCFDRVRAAVAPPNGRFGPAQLLSGLGTVTQGMVLAGLSRAGAPLVTWREGYGSASGHRTLVVAKAPGPPRAASPSRNRRPLRATITATRSRLRAAVRGAPLRLRVRCNQACAVRPTLTGRRPSVNGLPNVVLRRTGTVTLRERLSQRQRRRLRALLDVRVRAVGLATNRAGRLRLIRTVIR